MLHHLWLPSLDSDYLSFENKIWINRSMSELTLSFEQGVKPKQVALYLPSSCFVGAHKSLTRQQVAQLKPEAVSFMLENDTLTAPDQLLIRYVLEPEGLWISALDRLLLAQFDDFFSSLGAELVSVLPDYLLLPISSEPTHMTQQPEGQPEAVVGSSTSKLTHASLLLADETQLVRFREHAGAALIDPQLFIKRMQPSTVELIQTSDDPQSLEAIRAVSQVEISGHSINLLSPLPQPASHRLNMKMQRSLSLPKYLKVLLGLLGLVWLLWLATNLFNWSNYNRAAAVYESASLAQFKTWYPEERPGADLIAQIGSKLGGNSEASPLKLELGKISGVLGGFNITAFNYADGQLQLELLAQDQGELERLAQRLGIQGFTLNVIDTQPSDDQTKYLVRIDQPAGASDPS